MFSTVYYSTQGGTITGVGTGPGTGAEITGQAHIMEMEVPLEIFKTESQVMKMSCAWHQLIRIH